MSQNDNYLKILEKMAEMQSTVVRVETKVSGLEDDVREIKIEDQRQNQLLAEHIAGVQTNRERLELEIAQREQMLKQHEENSQHRFIEIDDRLKEVEFVPNLMKGGFKVLKWLGAAAAASVAIAKLMGYF